MADGLPKTASHPFYQKLNALLAEADFDRWIEKWCQRFYATEEKRGQPSIPPGVYFRMLLVGYFKTSTANAASPGGARTVLAYGSSWAVRWRTRRRTPTP